MLTEAQAKSKWCPLVRYLATFRNDADKLETAGCFNRGGADSGLEKSLCIASACMAWRWRHFVNRHIEKGSSDTGEGGPATGYCGAFGKPSGAA